MDTTNIVAAADYFFDIYKSKISSHGSIAPRTKRAAQRWAQDEARHWANMSANDSQAVGCMVFLRAQRAGWATGDMIPLID